MLHIALSSTIAIFFLFAAAASPALALNARSFVSAVGDDGNPCSRTQPCLTFQHAHDVTEAGGVIEPITPGGYGSVTITKAIKIVNHGVGTVGMFPAAGGAGVTINAGSSDHVVLEGLTIDGLGVGNNGILVNSAGTVAIVGCNISDTAPSSGNGIAITPSAQLNFAITDSYIAGNYNGVLVSASVYVTGVIERSTVHGNTFGISTFGAGGGSVTLDNSVATGNYSVVSGTSTTTSVYLSRSVIAGNTYGTVASNNNPKSFGDNRFVTNSNEAGFANATPK